MGVLAASFQASSFRITTKPVRRATTRLLANKRNAQREHHDEASLNFLLILKRWDRDTRRPTRSYGSIFACEIESLSQGVEDQMFARDTTAHPDGPHFGLSWMRSVQSTDRHSKRLSFPSR
jgi:hypothetical protein